MLNRIRLFIENHSDRKSFFTLIEVLFGKYDDRYKLILDAYNNSKAAFKEKFRDSGERFFEHQRRAALIYIFTGGHDADVIAAMLGHDIPEDIPEWSFSRMAHVLNQRVSQLVFGVSKEPISKFDNNKALRNAFYTVKLLKGSGICREMKLCDHLDNLMMISGLSKKKLGKIIAQCKNLYLPLAISEQFLFREILEALEIADKKFAEM